MQGYLFVDKPAGWTSFDVVNYVRRMVANHEGKKPKSVKVGHTGTLDPFATGLLIILVGKEYTRKAESLTKQDKTYEATFVLGKTSSTGDPEGEIIDLPAVAITQAEVQKTLELFTGEITQVPPQFSAIKINGQKAYDLARRGIVAEIPARTVTIHSLKLRDFEYPNVRVTARVSSGTYIRTLAEDIGSSLGSGAYCSELRRTQIADYDIKDAVDVRELTIEQLAAALRP